MQANIKLSSDTALQICAALGTLLRSKEVPKQDKDNIFKMIEGIKQFMTKADFEKYVKAMEYVEKNSHLISSLSQLLSADLDKE